MLDMQEMIVLAVSSANIMYSINYGDGIEAIKLRWFYAILFWKKNSSNLQVIFLVFQIFTVTDWFTDWYITI